MDWETLCASWCLLYTPWATLFLELQGLHKTSSWKGKLSLFNSLRKSCKMEVLFLVFLGMRNFPNQVISWETLGQEWATVLGFSDRLSKAHLPEPMVRAWHIPANSMRFSLLNALEAVNQIQVLPFCGLSSTSCPLLGTGARHMSGAVCLGATLDQSGAWWQFQQGMKFCMQSWALGVCRDIQKSVCVCLQTKCKVFKKKNVLIVACFSLGGEEEQTAKLWLYRETLTHVTNAVILWVRNLT